MAENEAKHGRDLAERRTQLFGDASVRGSRDDVFDIEAPEQGAPRANMSTLQAFQIALSSEEKAFDFYDRALPYVTRRSGLCSGAAGRGDGACGARAEGDCRSAPWLGCRVGGR